jgi:type I restriction-modification system DNA methylase subunit
VEDLKLLEQTIHGMELKPLPFMLCVTNLILHDIEVPNVDYTDSLNKEYTSISQKDRVDVILANPPFGASVTDGVETNFPQNYRTTESADLFLVLMIRYLKEGGRAAIVLPDGSLTGEGVKQRIRQHFLDSCNLHTIVRLPNSVFQPYASVATNLLFFEKGAPTREIWYWEHKLPEAVKAYSKTKPIKKNEFDSLKKWWDKRQANDQAWKVSRADLEAKGFNLDIKNACENSSGIVTDHFVDVNKMVDVGSGAKRNIEDIALTRYACYLVAQNGDPSKNEVAFAQTYFAVQTRKQEIIEKRLLDIARVQARQKLSTSEKKLSEIIYERGVDDRGFAIIRSRGDQALFGGYTTQNMRKKLAVPGGRPLADFLPTLTIKAKDFATELTSHNVMEKDLRG